VRALSASRSGDYIRYGKSRQGQQRYQCIECRHTFNAHTCTLFYRCRTPEKDIIEGLSMLVEGMSIRGVAWVKGVKPDTVQAWLWRAGAHAEQLERVLLPLAGGLHAGHTVDASEGEAVQPIWRR
jgi:transposase-like protein